MDTGIVVRPAADLNGISQENLGVGFERRKYDPKFRCRCWSRRCRHSNCRHKAVWKEYTAVIRSCMRLPPTHLISLRWPMTDNGSGSTQRINRFIRELGISDLSFRWWYDPTHPGFPHVHVLVRTTAELSVSQVQSAWLAAWDNWPVVWHDESKAAHVRPVGDVVDDVRYAIKHGWYHRFVPKGEWYGRMSGGDRRFLVSTKKSLFADMEYRDFGDVDLLTWEAEIRRRWPWLLCESVDTPPARALVRRSLLDSSILRLSKLPPDVSLLPPTGTTHRHRQCIKIIHKHRRRRTRLYCIWPRSP